MRAILVVFTRCEQTTPRFRVVHSNQLEVDLASIKEYLETLKGLTIQDYNVGIVDIDDNLEAYKKAEDHHSGRIVASSLSPVACRLLGIEIPERLKPPVPPRRPILKGQVVEAILH